MHMSNSEFLEKHILLKRNEITLQKDIVGFISRKDGNYGSIKCCFEDMLNSYEDEQQNEQRKFQMDLQKANHSIFMFQSELKKPRPGMIDQIKLMMEAIESQLLAIKDYQKSIYDNLITSETALSAELALFTADLPKYEKNIASRNVRYDFQKPRSQTSHQHNLHPAVIAFDKYNSTHGPTNKWGEFEHQLFLSHYSKSSNDVEMVCKMAEVLPFKTELQIQQQILWYRKFEDLEAAKKGALKEWREAKKTKNSAKNSEATMGNKSLSAIHSKKKELYDQERKERLAHLNAYKVQKELQRVMAEEEAIKAKIAEAEREARRKEYAQRQKEKLQCFKESQKQKQEAEAAAAHDEEMMKKAQNSVSQTSLLKLHQKNMELIERKQQSVQDKIVAEFEKQQKLEKMKHKVQVKSDPSRLLQKTKGQINREKDRSSSVNPIVGSRGMPSRAVPAWRKGL